MSKRDKRRQQGVTFHHQERETNTLEEVNSAFYGFDRLGDDVLMTDTGMYQYLGIEFNTVGFEEMPHSITVDEWQKFGMFIIRIGDAYQWLIGDWLLHGEDRPGWGDRYAEAIEMTGKKYSTLTTYKSIAKNIPFCRRRQNLDYSHHVEIANSDLPDDQKWALIEEAAQNQWSVRRIRGEIDERLNRKPALPSSEVLTSFATFLAKKRQVYPRFAKRFQRVGEGEKLQISQMIEDEIATLKALQESLYEE